MKTQVVKNIEKQINSFRKEYGYANCQTYITYREAIGFLEADKKHFKGFAKKKILDAPENAKVVVYCTNKSFNCIGGCSQLITCLNNGDCIVENC